jgi:hypothetical protein
MESGFYSAFGAVTYFDADVEPYTTTRPVCYDIPAFMKIPAGTKMEFVDGEWKVIKPEEDGR